MNSYLEQIPSAKKKLYCFSKIEKETKIDFFGEDILSLTWRTINHFQNSQHPPECHHPYPVDKLKGLHCKGDLLQNWTD